MRHTQARGQQRPFRLDGCGIGLEPNHHAGTVAAEVPDRLGNLALRLGREAIEPSLTLLVRPTASLNTPFRDVTPLRFILGQGRDRHGQ